MFGSSWAMPLWQSMQVASPDNKYRVWIVAARWVCLDKSIATEE